MIAYQRRRHKLKHDPSWQMPASMIRCSSGLGGEHHCRQHAAANSSQRATAGLGRAGRCSSAARQRQAVGSRAAASSSFGRATVLGKACLDHYRLALWRTPREACGSARSVSCRHPFRGLPGVAKKTPSGSWQYDDRVTRALVGMMRRLPACLSPRSMLLRLSCDMRRR